MSALPLTVFLSLALAGLFTLLFWREQRRRGLGGAERDSLLPLAEETPRTGTPTPAPAAQAGPAAEPAHDHADSCGCRRGLHPPCAGCRRQPAALR